MNAGRIYILAFALLTGCAATCPVCESAEAPVGQTPVEPAAARVAATLDPVAADFHKMRAASGAFGDGGVIVLTVGAEALTEGKKAGKWPDVELTDLWAHAIKEGSVLFNAPERRWGKTGPEETADIIGQTTIGPWQMTIQNVKHKYGPKYGVDPAWDDEAVYTFCRDNPKVQASMISDLIQENYDLLGKRSPYAIQCYFWLEAYAKREIGQGPWDKRVLPTAPDGDWKKLTPEMKADTGFYAKQLVCGSPTNHYGLLYWLAVTEKDAEIADLLRTWKNQYHRAWDAKSGTTIRTAQPGNFAIGEEDLKYLAAFPAEHARVLGILKQLAGERAPKG